MAKQSTPEPNDGLRTVAMGLMAAFESLGAEHQALTAEEKGTTSTERRATVRRMIQSVTDASRTLVHSVDQVAKVCGLRELGINEQMAKGADGSDYGPLLALSDPDEALYEAATYIQAAVRRLSEAYKPTKKHRDLARARRPQEMGAVLSGLRTALIGLRSEVVARDLTDDDAEFDPCIASLDELEERMRLVAVVPAQPAGPTADAVAAAILADPDIARAAAAALERATA